VRFDSATDTLSRLRALDLESIEVLQRVLLITDGTLTEILEAWRLERILLVKLAHQALRDLDRDELLEVQAADQVLERRILLCGEKTRINYVYAESLIAVDRLGSKFRHDLLHSNIPLGQLWLNHRLETLKEMVAIRRQPAGKLSEYFKISPEDSVFVRTYRVFSGAMPVMLITEHFPNTYSRLATVGPSATPTQPAS
jgi:chorismate-pyruvate lyase